MGGGLNMQNENLEFVIENGVLVEYKGQNSNIVIPNCVTVIGEYAFAKCETLRTVKLSEGVTKIERSAFASCVNLTDINIPSSVVHIGTCAFAYCESLKKIFLPKTVTVLGKYVFDQSDALTVYSEQPGEFWEWDEDWDGERETGLVKVVWGATKELFDKA